MKKLAIIAAATVGSLTLTGCEPPEDAEFSVEMVKLPDGNRATCVVVEQSDCIDCEPQVEAIDCDFG